MKKRAVGTLILCMLAVLAALSALASVRKVGWINARGAQLLEKPNKNATVLATLAGGEELTLLLPGTKYTRVEVGGVTGYVATQSIRYIGDEVTFDAPERGRITVASANLRARPDHSAVVVAQLAKNTAVEAALQIGPWLQVTGGKLTGYVSVAYTDIASRLPEYTELKMGATGKEVRYLQLALAQAGYYEGEINGVFGARVREAVRRFQKDNKLPDSGVATAATLALLYS